MDRNHNGKLDGDRLASRVVTIQPAPHGTQPIINIVGGAIPGLMVALDTIRVAQMLDLRPIVRVFEAQAFGGGIHDRVSTPRCHLWFHTHGQLYAVEQPSVTHAIQRSTQRLLQIAQHAFTFPRALVVDPKVLGRPPLTAYYQAARVPHIQIPTDVVLSWYPMLNLRPDDRVYQVTDGTMNLQILSYTLARRAEQAGITLVRQQVDRLILRGDTVRAIVPSDEIPITLTAQDQVVLACGANIRPLLAKSDIQVPGLRHFQSHLIATDAFGLDLITMVHGDVNCIPHRGKDGRILNIFGDRHRLELLPENDGHPLTADNHSIERIRQAVRESFGLHIPTTAMAWPAIKTEIIDDTAFVRSVAHQARLVPGLENCWLALPGKLSQSAAMSWDLALQIVGRFIGGAIAEPIWSELHREPGLPKSLPTQAA